MTFDAIRLALCAACLALYVLPTSAIAAPPEVTVARVPGEGLQPEVAVDAHGVVHLIYLKCDPAACDIFYTQSHDNGATWDVPFRVNSQPGSALAIGTIRGAHLALGAHGFIHVAWAGSKKSEPRAPGDQNPMLYARGSVDSSGKVRFEPQRNVVTAKSMFDGGAVAADDAGHVYVAWHAPDRKGGSEDDRRVWAAVSSDNGATFGPEVAISDKSTGVCGCCGLDILADDGKLFALYRSATEEVNRDMYLVTANALAADPRSQKIGPSRSNTCVMSTSSLTRGISSIVGAWETNQTVQWGVVDAKTGQMSAPITAATGNAKHPSVAVNAKGETLVAWAAGTGWNKGGSVSWQAYDLQGAPIAGMSGHADGLAVWSKPATFARNGGGFVVLY